MRYMMFILFLVLMSGCRSREPDEAEAKIIGGTELSEDQFPSVRKLKKYTKQSDGSLVLTATCGMTFVRPNIALTAAHCLCGGDRYVFSEKVAWEDYVAQKTARHPQFQCGARSPNRFDVGFVWFDPKLSMPVSPIIPTEPSVNVKSWTLVGYGKNILKVTGRFWTGGRVIVTESARPSPRKGEREFDGKHSGNVEWSGKTSDSGGFMSLIAEFDATTPVEGPSDRAASGEGDSGGPALTREGGYIIGVMSRGGETFNRPGAGKVTCYTDVIDLRREELRGFLNAHLTDRP